MGKSVYQLGMILVIVVAYFGFHYLNGIYFMSRFGFSPMPEKPETPIKPPPAYNIRIAVIAPSNESDDIKALFEITARHIHKYLESIERDESFALTVFVDSIGWDNDSASQHLEKVTSFKAMGYSFIVGGFTESQVLGSLPYINQYDMILISPTVTTNRPIGDFKGFFSLVPNATSQMRSVANAIMDYDLKATIIIEPNENQEKESLRLFSEAYQKRGGAIIGSLSSNTSLRVIESLAGEAVNAFPPSRICVLNLNSSRIPEDLRGFPTISNLTWVTYGDGYTGSDENWREYGSGFKVLSIRPAFTEILRWKDLKAEFRSKTSRELNWKYGNWYDSIWLYCLGILETEDIYHAAINIEAIPAVSKQYSGVTGDCTLNTDGDRNSLPYKLFLIGTNQGSIEDQ